MKKINLIIPIILLVSVAGRTIANPPQVLSDNRNTGACDTTDTARFKLNKPARDLTAGIWYDTNKGGDNLQFQLIGDQGVISSGAFVKGSCDPYQGQWCEGVAKLNGRDLAAGTYTVKAGAAALCTNTQSGGGFILITSVESTHKGYELYLNSKLVSGPDAASYTLQQAQENCAWNLKNHPKGNVVCMMDGRDVTSTAVTIKGNNDSSTSIPPTTPCISDPTICTNPFVENCCVTITNSVSTVPKEGEGTMSLPTAPIEPSK